jgi:hypothetical protein
LRRDMSGRIAYCPPAPLRFARPYTLRTMVVGQWEGNRLSSGLLVHYLEERKSRGFSIGPRGGLLGWRVAVIRPPGCRTESAHPVSQTGVRNVFVTEGARGHSRLTIHGANDGSGLVA